MFSVDDMKDCIQEWFSEALTPVEVAKTYHTIAHEAEQQLAYTMGTLTENEKD